MTKEAPPTQLDQLNKRIGGVERFFEKLPQTLELVSIHNELVTEQSVRKLDGITGVAFDTALSEALEQAEARKQRLPQIEERIKQIRTHVESQRNALVEQLQIPQANLDRAKQTGIAALINLAEKRIQEINPPVSKQPQATQQIREAVTPPPVVEETPLSKPATPLEKAEELIPTVEPVRPQMPEPETREIKSRHKDDLSEKMEIMASKIYELNEDRTDFAFPDWKQIVVAAYAETLIQLPTKAERQQRLNKLFSPANKTLRALLERIRMYDPNSDKTPYLKAFISSLKTQPEYQNLSNDDLVAIADGNLTFEKMKQKMSQMPEPQTIPVESSTEAEQTQAPQEPEKKSERETRSQYLTPEYAIALRNIVQKGDTTSLQDILQLFHIDEQSPDAIENLRGKIMNSISAIDSALFVSSVKVPERIIHVWIDAGKFHNIHPITSHGALRFILGTQITHWFRKSAGHVTDPNSVETTRKSLECAPFPQDLSEIEGFMQQRAIAPQVTQTQEIEEPVVEKRNIDIEKIKVQMEKLRSLVASGNLDASVLTRAQEMLQKEGITFEETQEEEQLIQESPAGKQPKKKEKHVKISVTKPRDGEIIVRPRNKEKFQRGLTVEETAVLRTVAEAGLGDKIYYDTLQDKIQREMMVLNRHRSGILTAGFVREIFSVSQLEHLFHDALYKMMVQSQIPAQRAQWADEDKQAWSRVQIAIRRMEETFIKRNYERTTLVASYLNRINRQVFKAYKEAYPRSKE